MIRLDPMTGEEFAAYEQAGIASYAESHVRNGIWPAETALERATKEYAKFLPQGLATPGHHLRVARDGDRRIGTVWFGGTAACVR